MSSSSTAKFPALQLKPTGATSSPSESAMPLPVLKREPALHWHGLLQTGTPWENGVPSVSQCPIAPGKSLTYSFKADLYGTSWYHSHYSAHYAGGILGPMIIYGPKNANYDIDLGPVLLTDYYHMSYYDIVEEVMGTNLSLTEPRSVNNLIKWENGL